MLDSRPWPSRLSTHPPLLLLSLVVLAVSACDDPSPPQMADSAKREQSAAPARWQEVTDKTPTALFLARVAESRDDISPSEPLVSQYETLLTDARAYYVETPRMLANRLIQGRDRLAELNAAMPIPELLHAIESAAGQTRRSFTSDLHHYLNLRDAGVGHDDAIRQLAREARDEGF
jgi:hypothetical protein